MPIDINSAHPLSIIIFSPLSLLRSQLHAHERGNINAGENCNKESPAPMETGGLNLPGFGWTAPKCGRGCDCTDKEKRPPGDHVDSPLEAATTVAPDGSSAFAALEKIWSESSLYGLAGLLTDVAASLASFLLTKRGEAVHCSGREEGQCPIAVALSNGTGKRGETE